MPPSLQVSIPSLTTNLPGIDDYPHSTDVNRVCISTRPIQFQILSSQSSSAPEGIPSAVTLPIETSVPVASLTSVNSARILSHFLWGFTQHFVYLQEHFLWYPHGLYCIYWNGLFICLFLLLDPELLKGGDSDLFILFYVRSVTVPASVV